MRILSPSTTQIKLQGDGFEDFTNDQLALTNNFIKSHVDSKKLIRFSVTAEKSSRDTVEFLTFLKSLPYVCNFYLSRIQHQDLPVNIKDRGRTKISDLKTVHETLNSLEASKRRQNVHKICEMYDDNLNPLPI